MKAGQQTFEPNTKDGHVAISVVIDDLADGEFDLYFSTSGGAAPVGRAAIRLLEGQTVWVKHIEVEPAFRRKGYGSAFVQWMHRVCAAPIVPVEERGDGPAFWAAMRTTTLFSGSVADGISRTTYTVALRQLGLVS